MPPERVERWLAGFAARHDAITGESLSDGVVTVTGGDGGVAELHVPFPPLAGEDLAGLDPVRAVVEHALRDRVLGLLLARRGGHAVGVYGGGEDAATKVGRRHVQGRTAAGGWSQQRFARRRAGQTAVAAGAAADAAVAVLLPRAADLAALVTGGDRSMVTGILADPRLARLRPLVAERFLPVPDPRRDVLEAAVAQARAVHIRVLDADPD